MSTGEFLHNRQIEPFVSLHKQFISPAEHAGIMAQIPNISWDCNLPTDNVWYNRYVHYQHMMPQLQAIVGPIRQRVRQQIQHDFGVTQPLYADTLQIVRWVEGNMQHPHADAEQLDGSAHPFPWRAYASIIYLNDDFEGGQIYFPQHNLEPKIEPGILAFFPGDRRFIHGVKPVTKGVRYTIASFFTFDASKYDGAPI